MHVGRFGSPQTTATMMGQIVTVVVLSIYVNPILWFHGKATGHMHGSQ